jgi:hypothetical protein
MHAQKLVARSIVSPRLTSALSHKGSCIWILDSSSHRPRLHKHLDRFKRSQSTLTARAAFRILFEVRFGAPPVRGKGEYSHPLFITYNNPDLHSGLYSADFRRKRKEG